MASKAAIIGGADPTEADTAAEEREGLLHPSHEQEIRNRIRDLSAAQGRIWPRTGGLAAGRTRTRNELVR